MVMAATLRVGKQRVTTDVLKARFLVTTQHLRLPVRPQRERRVSAPGGMLPEMREGFGGLRRTAGEAGQVFSSLDLRHRAIRHSDFLCPLDHLLNGIGLVVIRRRNELVWSIALHDQSIEVSPPSRTGLPQIASADLKMAACGVHAPEHDLIIQYELSDKCRAGNL